MKFLTLTALLVAFQGGMSFRDRVGNVQISAKEGLANRVEGKLTLVGKVVAIQKDQGLEIRADEVDVKVSDPSKKAQIQEALAKGNVVLKKSVSTRQGAQTTQIEGRTADYKAGATEGKVLLTGPATIRSVRESKRETMVATGDRGSAVLELGQKGSGPSGLKSAELVGNVKVTIDSVGPKGSPSRLVATANRLIVDEASKQPTITLLDNVEMNGEGDYAIRLSKTRRVTMKLNEKGEVISLKSERGQ